MQVKEHENEITKRNPVKLSNEQINLKITSAFETIKRNVESLAKFSSDLQPQESVDFQKIVKLINFQYFCLHKYDVKLEDIKRLRFSNASILIELDIFNIYYQILVQLFHDVFDKNYSEEINFKLDSTITNLISIFFNYTDSSADFGKEFCKNNKLLKLYHKIISEFKNSCLDKSLSKNLLNILRISISTLYNTMLHDVNENYIKMREMKFLDLIKDFMNCKEEKIKRSSLLFVAYIADETESKLFKSDLQSCSYLIKLLKNSMNTRFDRYQGLSTEELSKGIEKLSKNDENKRLLVELGILPVLKIQMAKDDLQNKKLALAVLWSLAFDEKNKITIINEFTTELSEMKKKLDEKCNTESASTTDRSNRPIFENQILRLSVENKNVKRKKKSNDIYDDISPIEAQINGNTNEIDDNLKCRNLLNGLTWTLTNSEDEKEKKLETVNEKSRTKNHIMISYNWTNLDIVMKIYKSLVENGYKLWIDKYNISENENLMESMAQAVQNSYAVIICVSHNYKNSENCRAEAQYATYKKKPLIPIMVQEKYRPDGWLGICIIGLQYCDFLGKYNFEEALALLFQQIKRIETGNKDEKIEEIDHVDAVHTKNQSQSRTDTTKWTNEKCKQWFKEIGIKKINWQNHYTGNELDFLKSISQVPGEVFFEIAKAQLQISDLRDLRILFQNLQIL